MSRTPRNSDSDEEGGRGTIVELTCGVQRRVEESHSVVPECEIATVEQLPHLTPGLVLSLMCLVRYMGWFFRSTVRITSVVFRFFGTPPSPPHQKSQVGDGDGVTCSGRKRVGVTETDNLLRLHRPQLGRQVSETSTRLDKNLGSKR